MYHTDMEIDGWLRYARLHINSNLYCLDYANKSNFSITSLNGSITIPANGIISLNWRNLAGQLGTVGLTSAKRGGDYIHLMSNYHTIATYAFGEYIVEKGDVITATVFDNVHDSYVGIRFYPFK